MTPFELLHYIEVFLNVVLGVFIGSYALRTFRLLKKNPEVLKSQSVIWVPILISGGIFFVSGVFTFLEHLFFFEELHLVTEYSLFLGSATLGLAIIRYWRLQKEYFEKKSEGIRSIKSDNKQVP